MNIRNLLAILALLAATLTIAPSAEAHHYKPIQPGALLGKLCTLNFVFEDETGAKYIGAAGHCVPRVGRRVITPEIGEFGTVVYWRNDSTNFTNPKNATGPLLDFALIAIDSDKYPLVDPAVRGWGGPTGIETTYAPGTVTLHYGQGLFFQATEPSRARYGVLQDEYDSGPFTDWYLASHVIMGGDSGSGLITHEGKALGIVDTVAATFGGQPGVVGGPTVELVLRMLHETGFQVQLVTAPFRPPTDAASNAARATETVSHCQNQLRSDPSRPNGCIREQWYTYHSISILQNTTRWEPHNWGVMANSDPRLCPETPWYPTLLEHPCQVHILLAEIPDGFWDDREGRLRLLHEWRSPDHKVDFYVYDSQGSLVAQDRGGTTNRSSIVIEQPAKDAYRIVMVPVRYIETDYERLRDGDEAFRATAILDFEPAMAQDPANASEDSAAKATPAPAAPLFLAWLVAVAWLARRRHQ